MKEKWKVIKYRNIKPNMYMVSNFGNVKNIKTNKLLNPWKGKNGYLYVSLMTTDNKPKHIGCHVLVCESFIKKLKKQMNDILVPNHKNFIRSDNLYTNLEWVTYAENNEYNRKHGHYKSCDSCNNSKISNKKVHKICKLMEDGLTNNEIIKKMKFPTNEYYKALLTAIRTGREWKDISSLYDIKIKNLLRTHTDEEVEKICKYLEDGVKPKQIYLLLGSPGTNYQEYKNLITGIRLRRSYKYISKNYNW